MAVAAERPIDSGKPWYSQITWVQWKALIAAWGVWTLDAVDFLVLTYVLSDIAKTFGIPMTTASLLLLMTYGVRWFGGLIFGNVSDRIGRKIPLAIALVWFTVCAVLTGLSWSWTAIIVFRLLLGLGMAPGFAVGATLVAETWPERYRAIGLGLQDTGWGFGGLFASLIFLTVYPHFGWRSVFFVGVIPALLFAAFILMVVQESPVWQARTRGGKTATSGGNQPAIQLFTRHPGRVAILSALLFSLFFCNWPLLGLFPTYLKSLNFSTSVVGSLGMSISLGQIAGYIASGFLAERFGRKGGLTLMLMAGLVSVIVMVLLIHSYMWALVWSFLAGGLIIGSAGIWSSILAENLPTDVRASGVGFLYNIGSFGGGLAPFVVLATLQDFHLQFSIGLAGYTVLAGVIGIAILRLIPETRGIKLAD